MMRHEFDSYHYILNVIIDNDVYEEAKQLIKVQSPDHHKWW